MPDRSGKLVYVSELLYTGIGRIADEFVTDINKISQKIFRFLSCRLIVINGIYFDLTFYVTERDLVIS
jgi:hypothetical protein